MVEKTRFWFIEGVSFTSEELARSREPLEIDDYLMSNQLVERLKIAIRSRLAIFAGGPIEKEEETPITVQETSLDLGDGDTRHVVCVELDDATLDGFGWMMLLPDPEKVHESFSKGMLKFTDAIVKEFHDCVAEQMFDNEDAVVNPIHEMLKYVPGSDFRTEVASQYRCFVENLFGAIYETKKQCDVFQVVTAPDGSKLLEHNAEAVSEIVEFEDLMKDKLIKWQMERDLTQGLPQ